MEKETSIHESLSKPADRKTTCENKLEGRLQRIFFLPLPKEKKMTIIDHFKCTD